MQCVPYIVDSNSTLLVPSYIYQRQYGFKYCRRFRCTGFTHQYSKYFYFIFINKIIYIIYIQTSQLGNYVRNYLFPTSEQIISQLNGTQEIIRKCLENPNKLIQAQNLNNALPQIITSLSTTAIHIDTMRSLLVRGLPTTGTIAINIDNFDTLSLPKLLSRSIIQPTSIDFEPNTIILPVIKDNAQEYTTLLNSIEEEQDSQLISFISTLNNDDNDVISASINDSEQYFHYVRVLENRILSYNRLYTAITEFCLEMFQSESTSIVRTMCDLFLLYIYIYIYNYRRTHPDSILLQIKQNKTGLNCQICSPCCTRDREFDCLFKILLSTPIKKRHKSM